MDGAHFHLLVNHIPIVGTIFGMLILMAGLLLKNDTVKQTGLGALIVSALSSALALFTGDPAGDAVKGLPGVMESMIDHHENIAYSSLWALVPMGLLAALAFYSLMKKERAGGKLAFITFIISLVAVGMMSWVGLSGGEIRHTEIRKQPSAHTPVRIENKSETKD